MIDTEALTKHPPTAILTGNLPGNSGPLQGYCKKQWALHLVPPVIELEKLETSHFYMSTLACLH